MFCARRRVFSKLAAVAAGRPVCPWGERFGRDTFGSGLAAVVVVLAIEANVWTRELRRGVVWLLGDDPSWLGVE